MSVLGNDELCDCIWRKGTPNGTCEDDSFEYEATPHTHFKQVYVFDGKGEF